HFARIAQAEGAKFSEAALALIARAADGSVRDGLSLLDQAIARADVGAGDKTEIDEATVREMLGLADRSQLFDLFERAMKGDAPGTLSLLAELYKSGADPVVVLQDLLGLTHWLTRVKLVPETVNDPALPETERTRGKALADALAIPVLARAWQMLLKGLGETQTAPSPLQAAEMALIRLIHASTLPTPGDLVKRIEEQGGVAAIPAAPRGGGTATSSGGARGNGATAAVASGSAMGAQGGASSGVPTNALAVGAEVLQAQAHPAPNPLTIPDPQSFEALVTAVAKMREGMLHGHLLNDVHLVHFEPGRIEIRPGPGAPTNLANKLGTLLTERTGRRWVIAISSDAGQATLREQAQAEDQRQRREASAHPLVQAVMKNFPGASIEAVRQLKPEPAAVAAPSEETGGDDSVADELPAD
ncbi:MAG: DNA polymerase III subunit gamma/tau, partial [Hypericibacter sp.]